MNPKPKINKISSLKHAVKHEKNSVNDSAGKMIAAGPGIPNIIDDYIGAAPVFTVIGNSSDSIDVPQDLDFHPILTRNELWVILKGTENSGGYSTKIAFRASHRQTLYDTAAGHHQRGDSV